MNDDIIPDATQMKRVWVISSKPMARGWWIRVNTQEVLISRRDDTVNRRISESGLIKMLVLGINDRVKYPLSDTLGASN